MQPTSDDAGSALPTESQTIGRLDLDQDLGQSWQDRFTYLLQSRVARVALIVMSFLVFTVGMLWPLPLRAGSAVQDLGDPLYEIWTMRWVQHQLITDPSHLWDGNTGYPFADSLLFSEPRISTSVIAAPIQVLTGNDILSYNIMLMGSYFVVGVGMTLLIWELTGELGAAILTGFVSAFVPYRFGHLSHLNLLSYGWTMLALWCLIRFARRRTLLDVIFGAVFLAIQLLASDTVGLMAGFTCGTAIIFLLWHERERLTARFAGGLVLFVGFPALVELPVVLARIRVDRMYGFARSLNTISEMSATLQTYWSISPGSPFWRSVQILPSAYPNPLFPGVLATLAALAGLVLGIRHLPRWTLYAALIAVVGFTLSLGPFASIGGHRYHLPYYLMYTYVPGFNAMRDAARFGMVALIGVEILAGIGFAALWKWLRPRIRTNSRSVVGGALVVVLLGSASVELKVNVGTATVPNDTSSSAVYSWLASQPTGPVIEFPADGLWTNLGWTIRQIYFSTRHWDPIVAAYTSFIPKRDVSLLVAINEGTKTPSLVNAANVGLLQDLGIRYLVIHHWANYDWQLAVSDANKLPELTRVGDMGDATVFTLGKGARIPVVHQLAAPETGIAGRKLIASFVTRNDNPTMALNWLQQDPQATIEWESSSGATVSSTKIPLHLDVTANPGLTIQPLTITAPSDPGTYHLTISTPAVAQTLKQTVTISSNATATQAADQAALVLRQLQLPSGPYRPGEWLEIDAEWQVRRPASKNLTSTVQLLSDAHQVIAQWDGQPFGADLPTSRWETGTTVAQPMLVQIPANTTAASFRVMIALYDESSPNLQRTPIEGPNGNVDTQFISGRLTITAGNK